MPVSNQGLDKNRYTLIPRVLVFLTRDERVLLLKGAPHKRLWANRYNGVGGHVERGEDPLSAARRELTEETGLEVADLWLCGILTVDTGENTGVGVFIWRGECPAGDPVPSPEGTPEWVPFQELDRLPLVEDLFLLLPRLLTMRPGDPPFFARSSYDSEGRLTVHF